MRDLAAQGGLRSEVTASGVVPAVLLVVLLALLLTALGALRRGRSARRAGAALLVPASLAWVAFNGRIEGPVLFTVTPEHGVTVSDLLGVAGLAVAGAVLLRRR